MRNRGDFIYNYLKRIFANKEKCPRCHKEFQRKESDIEYILFGIIYIAIICLFFKFFFLYPLIYFGSIVLLLAIGIIILWLRRKEK